MDPKLYSRLLFRLLALPVGSLLLLALFLVFALQRVQHSARAVDHADRVLAHANYLSKLVIDEETGLRGYLLSGNPVFLEPFHQADQTMNAEFDTLFDLVRSHPDLTARLKQIEKLQTLWEEDARQQIVTGKTATGQTKEMLNRKRKMDQLRGQLDDFLRAEAVLRADRSATANDVDSLTLPTLIGVVMFLALLVGWATSRYFGALATAYSRQLAEAKRYGEEAYSREQWLNTTLRSIGDAVIACDSEGKVQFMNKVAEDLTGWAEEKATGLPLQDVFHIINEETRAVVENPVAKVRRLGTTVGLANHTVLIARDGSGFPIEDSAAPIRNDQGHLIGMVLVFHDVTEQRRLSGELNHRASHDALTGLFNRTEFESRLHRLLQRVQADHSQNALLYIDLDQFKIVNDTCGHAVGDQLLCQAAKLLSGSLRASDTVARLGGDEFAIILEHCPMPKAQLLAERLCLRMDNYRFIHEERPFRIGASIGLVPVDDRWSNATALLQAADTSCYEAKEAGRNRVHLWSDTEETLRGRQGETQWAVRLERALDEGRFVLFAQRIKPLRTTGRGVFAEVLLRMLDDDGSLISPGAFLPAAERFHLASRIDRWVLKEVILWMKSLLSLHFIECLNINLSGQSVGDRAFHRWASDVLFEAGPAVCEKLCLEITETAAVTNLADAALFIEQVRRVGVRVALDDFGSGASWFGYLKKMRVDLLKIDGQFIRELVTDPLEEATVRCFAEIAREIGMETVAECVEDAAALERLSQLGVDFAQGFLIHRPAPLDELFEFHLADPDMEHLNAEQSGSLAEIARPAVLRMPPTSARPEDLVV